MFFFPSGIADEDLLEDETDAVCSSFLPQPPTPDLLKNTSRSKNEACKVLFFFFLFEFYFKVFEKNSENIYFENSDESQKI